MSPQALVAVSSGTGTSIEIAMRGQALTKRTLENNLLCSALSRCQRASSTSTEQAAGREMGFVEASALQIMETTVTPAQGNSHR